MSGNNFLKINNNPYEQFDGSLSEKGEFNPYQKMSTTISKGGKNIFGDIQFNGMKSSN